MFLIPFSKATRKKKKSEQTIKVTVDNGSGTKVVIDTVLYNTPEPDSIRTKDGTVIYINHDNQGHLKHKRERGNIVYYSSSESRNDNVFVSDTSSESALEKSRFVIAKDGMVVTIEGTDEAKTKELSEKIEKLLGTGSEGKVKKETVKVESSKSVKK